jgi:hypothetical protein
MPTAEEMFGARSSTRPTPSSHGREAAAALSLGDMQEVCCARAETCALYGKVVDWMGVVQTNKVVMWNDELNASKPHWSLEGRALIGQGQTDLRGSIAWCSLNRHLASR